MTNPLVAQGDGYTVCPVCQHTQIICDGEQAVRCCGAIPAIYDKAYREAVKFMERHS